uniref:Uncharacterized protein n=1 Tax=Spironucleus salmonicida TaxID=348837 RepID=V6LLI2_9EUKA|eukprot:EST44621.1 Hypothetical protein SS50377_15626 [Spironucleus salmonicida]
MSKPLKPSFLGDKQAIKITEIQFSESKDSKESFAQYKKYILQICEMFQLDSVQIMIDLTRNLAQAYNQTSLYDKWNKINLSISQFLQQCILESEQYHSITIIPNSGEFSQLFQELYNVIVKSCINLRSWKETKIHFSGIEIQIQQGLSYIIDDIFLYEIYDVICQPQDLSLDILGQIMNFNIDYSVYDIESLSLEYNVMYESLFLEFCKLDGFWMTQTCFALKNGQDIDQLNIVQNIQNIIQQYNIDIEQKEPEILDIDKELDNLILPSPIDSPILLPKTKISREIQKKVRDGNFDFRKHEFKISGQNYQKDVQLQQEVKQSFEQDFIQSNVIKCSGSTLNQLIFPIIEENQETDIVDIDKMMEHQKPKFQTINQRSSNICQYSPPQPINNDQNKIIEIPIQYTHYPQNYNLAALQNQSSINNKPTKDMRVPKKFIAKQASGNTDMLQRATIDAPEIDWTDADRSNARSTLADLSMKEVEHSNARSTLADLSMKEAEAEHSNARSTLADLSMKEAEAEHSNARSTLADLSGKEAEAEHSNARSTLADLSGKEAEAEHSNARSTLADLSGKEVEREHANFKQLQTNDSQKRLSLQQSQGSNINSLQLIIEGKKQKSQDLTQESLQKLDQFQQSIIDVASGITIQLDTSAYNLNDSSCNDLIQQNQIKLSNNLVQFDKSQNDKSNYCYLSQHEIIDDDYIQTVLKSSETTEVLNSPTEQSESTDILDASVNSQNNSSLKIQALQLLNKTHLKTLQTQLKSSHLKYQTIESELLSTETQSHPRQINHNEVRPEDLDFSVKISPDISTKQQKFPQKFIYNFEFNDTKAKHSEMKKKLNQLDLNDPANLYFSQLQSNSCEPKTLKISLEDICSGYEKSLQISKFSGINSNLIKSSKPRPDKLFQSQIGKLPFRRQLELYGASFVIESRQTKNYELSGLDKSFLIPKK